MVRQKSLDVLLFPVSTSMAVQKPATMPFYGEMKQNLNLKLYNKQTCARISDLCLAQSHNLHTENNYSTPELCVKIIVLQGESPKHAPREPSFSSL